MKKNSLIIGKNPLITLLNNLGLLFFGSTMVFSGILVQFGYHHGHHGKIDTSRLVFGFNYFHWSDLHKISILLISLGMVFHILWHWKWYKTVTRKKTLILKNQQTLILSVIFLLVAVTGYISWGVKLSGGSEITRKLFMEIHDKITWILLGYLIFHIAKRSKWFFTMVRKIKNPAKYSNRDKRALNPLAREYKQMPQDYK